MKNIVSRLFLFSILIFASINLFSQENYAVNIKKEVSSSDKMLITYDIKTDSGGKYFNVIILITHEGQKVPTNSAYGDYGSKISPGKEKAIVWYYKNDFEGDVEKVEVDVFAYKENEPQAGFLIGSKSNNGYAPCEVAFVNKSTYANDYRWDFGDPGSGIKNHSFEKEPSHVYEKGGNYEIKLVAANTDLEMESESFFTLRILEHPPVIADFEYTITSGLPPYEVEFRDISTNAESYEWNFGDPSSGNRKNTSNSIDPKHKFKNSGTYQVTLTVSNSVSGLTNTITKDLILSEPDPPVANFVFTLTSEIAPAIAVFKNTSTNADAYLWDFGDPQSGSKNESREQNPNHTFNIPGKYEVKLTAGNNQTGKTTFITQIVDVLEPPRPPESGFTIQNNNVIAPSTIIFNNTSSNADRYIWNFGDPGSGDKNISDKRDPTHTYTKAGRYEVKLESISTSLGISDFSSDIVVMLEPAMPPEAGFRYQAGELIAPVSVKFTNTSLNSDRYLWNFGDPGSGNNNQSSEVSPTHQFLKGGSFRISLTSTNTESGESSIHVETITIAEPVKLPVASYTFNVGDGVAPAEVKFQNNSVNSDSFLWDFGDPGSGGSNSSDLRNPVHTFTRAGTYKVVLTSKSNKVEEPSIFTDEVIVTEPAKPPVSRFSFEAGEAIVPAAVSFINNSLNAETFNWNFDDPESGNNNTSNLENPNHVFSKPGTYKVVLLTRNSRSEEESTHFENVVIKELVIEPVPDFRFDPEEAEAPAEISFYNLSSLSDSYSWNFGDPSSGIRNNSTETNPSHLFQKEGTYQVTLKATNESSSESRQVIKSIVISRPIPPPIADFNYILDGNTAPVEVTFTNNSMNCDKYEWEFGDTGSGANTSKEPNPRYIYQNPGSYTVLLSVTNSQTGKTDRISKTVNIASEYKTFVRIEGEASMSEISKSIIREDDGTFLVLISVEGSGSRFIRINKDGENILERDFDIPLYDIDVGAVEGKYVVAGYRDSLLTIQNMSWDLEMEEAVELEGVPSLDLSFSTPRIATSINDEVGIVGNIVESGEPVDFWFQKLDQDGIPVPVRGRTFKFIGIKIENELIPSLDGGFAVTGFWQEDETKPRRLMFATVDKSGKGYLKAITAVTNFIGCDIVNSHSNGYGILAAQGSAEDESKYNIVFMIVDLDGGPVSFSGPIHGDLFIDDMQAFPPCLLKTDGGYVIGSHFHNGTDYDIKISWLDITGEMIMKQESISRPGDQFISDILELEDGSYILIGAEKSGDTYDALIMRTDPFGRVNPDSN